jgi:hypothetical protein
VRYTRAEQAALDWLATARLLPPSEFGRQVLGMELWSKQAEWMDAVEYYPRVSVRTCHQVGKTFGAAEVVVWWTHTRYHATVLTTAPTAHQVRALLWKEIKAALPRLPPILQQMHYDCLQTELRFRTPAGGIDPLWYAYGRSTDDPTLFQGEHGEHLMVVVDEAAGVEDDILGVLPTFGAEKVLLIGNPTRDDGHFYRSHQDPALGYTGFKIAAADSPNFTGEAVSPFLAGQLITPGQVELMKAEWGEDSPWYRARVLAEFPSLNAQDVLIPLGWLDRAKNRSVPEELEGDAQVGFDVARYGGDRTVAACRIGGVLLRIRSLESADLNQVASFAQQECQWLVNRTRQNVRCLIDSTGVGAGVYDRLKHESGQVRYYERQFGAAAKDKEHYANWISETMWHLRDRCGDSPKMEPLVIGCDGPEVNRLIAQVSARKFFYDPRGRIVLETKDEMKKRHLPSPDEADATGLAFAPASTEFRVHRVPGVREVPVALGWQP